MTLGTDTLFGHRAELRIYMDDTGRTFLTPARPFLATDDGRIEVDIQQIGDAIISYQRDQKMRAGLAGVRTSDGKLYAPEDIELVYEDQG